MSASYVNTPGIVLAIIADLLGMLTSELVKAARALIRWEQKDLAEESGVSLPTIKRLEAKPGNINAHSSTISAIQSAFERQGIEFIHENCGGPGLRLGSRHI